MRGSKSLTILRCLLKLAKNCPHRSVVHESLFHVLAECSWELPGRAPSSPARGQKCYCGYLLKSTSHLKIILDHFNSSFMGAYANRCRDCHFCEVLRCGKQALVCPSLDGEPEDRKLGRVEGVYDLMARLVAISFPQLPSNCSG